MPENTEASPTHPEPGEESRITGLHPPFAASPEAVITFTSGHETHGFKYLVSDHPSVDTDMVLVSAGLSRAHCGLSVPSLSSTKPPALGSP